MRTTSLDLSNNPADQTNTSEGWSWVQSTQTLTLNSCFIMTSNGNGISLPDRSTVLLAAGNVNEATTATGSSGIYANGWLTIDNAAGAMGALIANGGGNNRRW